MHIFNASNRRLRPYSPHRTDARSSVSWIFFCCRRIRHFLLMLPVAIQCFFRLFVVPVARFPDPVSRCKSLPSVRPSSPPARFAVSLVRHHFFIPPGHRILAFRRLRRPVPPSPRQRPSPSLLSVAVSAGAFAGVALSLSLPVCPPRSPGFVSQRRTSVFHARIALRSARLPVFVGCLLCRRSALAQCRRVPWFPYPPLRQSLQIDCQCFRPSRRTMTSSRTVNVSNPLQSWSCLMSPLLGVVPPAPR